MNTILLALEVAPDTIGALILAVAVVALLSVLVIWRECGR